MKGRFEFYLKKLRLWCEPFCICPYLTRKYLWNTNRPQPPPNSKGYGLCRFKIYFLWKPLFLVNLTTSGRVFPEKPLFWAILANLTTSGGVVLTEMVKRHIYGPRPFIWAYNQVSMTFRSKVLVRTRKRWQTDRQTDRQTDGQTDTPTL